MIGIRISPYDCSDLPNKDSPDVAFNRVTENAQTNKAVYWGWQVSENALMWALISLCVRANLSSSSAIECA